MSEHRQSSGSITTITTITTDLKREQEAMNEDGDDHHHNNMCCSPVAVKGQLPAPAFRGTEPSQLKLSQ